MGVIVTGTGRCGSSAVARVLHEQLGVFMGERFDRIRPPNPEGTYEDLDFRELHVALGRGELEREEFEERARALIAVRNAEHGERWGFKDPRAAHVLNFYLNELPDALVLIPCRDLTEVCKSIERHYGTAYSQARAESVSRVVSVGDAVRTRWGEVAEKGFNLVLERGCDAHVVENVLVLGMHERRTDEWIAAMIRVAKEATPV